MRRLPLLLALALAQAAAVAPLHAANSDPLAALVQVLQHTTDVRMQTDILKGISDGLKGRAQVLMPAGWEELATTLEKSADARVHELAQSLSLTFGSPRALASLRQQLRDKTASVDRRTSALTSLLSVHDAELPPTLRDLLAEVPLRSAALRGLAAYNDPATPGAILKVYPALVGTEKKDALSTLVARPDSARALLAAIDAGQVSHLDLSADLVRQLRNFKDTQINASVEKVWGVTRESSEDKLKETAKFKALLASGPAGNASRGRAVFSRTCQQCHTLFEVGGKVGPDITGANRGDIDYLLHNILDPNAEIPNDYRTTNIETKDGRSISGVVKQQDALSVTIQTPNELLTLARKDIDSLTISQLSMMPEGLLLTLSENEVRDLFSYLRSSSQVPLP